MTPPQSPSHTPSTPPSPEDSSQQSDNSNNTTPPHDEYISQSAFITKQNSANTQNAASSDKGPTTEPSTETTSPEPSTNTDSQNQLTKSGYLTKQGGNIKNWKTRWFLLKGPSKHLEYYTNDSMNRLKGRFPVEGLSVSEHPDPQRPNCFKIEARGRTWYLQAQSREEMFSWMDALQELGGAIQTLPDFTEADVKRAQQELGFRFDDDDSELSTVRSELEGRAHRRTTPSEYDNSSQMMDQEGDTIDGSVHSWRAGGAKRLSAAARSPSSGRLTGAFKNAAIDSVTKLRQNSRFGNSPNSKYLPGGAETTDTDSVAFTEDNVELPSNLFYQSDEDDDDNNNKQQEKQDSSEVLGKPAEPDSWDRKGKQKKHIDSIDTSRSTPATSTAPSSTSSPAGAGGATSNQSTTPTTNASNNNASSTNAAENKLPDLFSYFKSTSEDAKASKLDKQANLPSKSKPLKAELTDGALRNVDDYLEEAFSNIAVIASSSKNPSHEVDPEEIDRQIRRQKMNEKTEYDTPSDFSDDNSEHALLRREREFTDEFSDMVHMDNPMLKQIRRSGRIKSTFRRCMDVFRVYPYSVWTYILSALMVAIACVTYYWSDSLPHMLLYSKNEADNYRAFFLCENFLFYFRSLFSEQNRGALSVVTSLEVAISESGAYLQEYYLHGGSRNSLFLNGYVGRVLHMSVYTSVVAAFLTSACSVAFIGLYLRFLGQGKLVSNSRFYFLTRTPSILLTFVWSQFQSVMFGTLKMWEWMLWNLLTFGVFFLTCFGLLELLSDGLLSMGMVFNVALLVSVVGGVVVFSMPTFVQRHHSFTFSQDHRTVWRFIRLTLLTLCVHAWPIILDFIYHTVKSSKSEVHMLAVNVVNMPVTLFLQFGMLFNGISLVVGVRCVKRYRYDQFVFLIFKSLLNIACVIVVCLSLFFLTGMPSRSVHQILGHHYTNPKEEQKMVDKITELTGGAMWHIALLTVPAILLNNLYQTFLFCFERYHTLIFVSLLSNLIVGVPGLVLTLLEVESLAGWYVVQIVQNVASLLLLALIVHCYELPNLQKAEIREKMRRIDEDNQVVAMEDDVALI